MPLIRKQLKNDPVTARLAAHSTPEFRLDVAFGFVSTVLGAVAVTLFAHGGEAWAGAVVGISVAAIGLYKLGIERKLLGDYQTVVATVSHWSRTESEGGYVYSVRYRFLGPDGQVYLGKSGSSDRALPQEGATIPVLFRNGDPAQNMTLATFWFYRFTYTGTE
jgi:hypothetical protein